MYYNSLRSQWCSILFFLNFLVFSRFYFSCPHPISLPPCKKDPEIDIKLYKELQEPDLQRDEDGDLIVKRLTSHQKNKDVITIGKKKNQMLSSDFKW